MVSAPDHRARHRASATGHEATLVTRFDAALAANGGGCHGPYPPATAAQVTAEVAAQRSAGRPVALAGGDALLTRLGVAQRLEALGVPVLLPSDDAWRAEIASAGAGVTGAVAAAAATGSVAVACGPGAPRSTSLLPRAHICLLAVEHLTTDLSAALSALTSLPSGLAWVSGPSRSADLGMKITVGVHGPASFDVVLVAAAETAPTDG